MAAVAIRRQNVKLEIHYKNQQLTNWTYTFIVTNLQWTQYSDILQISNLPQNNAGSYFLTADSVLDIYRTQ
jgi:hypothetical protein